MKIAVHIRPNRAQPGVQAFCPDLPGCSAFATTEPEALALLRRRVDEYFAHSTLRAPAGTRVVTLEV